MKRMVKRAGRILTWMVSVCMMLMMALPVMAADETNNMAAAEDPRDSIMLMTLGFEDDAGNYHRYQSGTCFLINDEYVLTSMHVITVDDAVLKSMREDYAMPDLQKNDSHIKLKVYVNHDMKVAATMHASVNSGDMDFAAVKLAEKIYDRKPVAIGDCSTVEPKDTVYALGFPEDSMETKEYNTKEDVSTVSGTVSKLTVTGSVDIVEHTAPLNHGNSGGPLLDADNNVIGINFYKDATKNYSIQINAIKKGLDTFGIPYVQRSAPDIIHDVVDPDVKSGNEEEEKEKKPDNTAILAELRSALSDAKAVDTEKYTEESIKVLDDGIGAAEAVLANDAAEAAAIQNATDDLNDAINSLEEKKGPDMLLIGIIAAAVIVVIIIIIVAVMAGKKKKTTSVPGRTEPGTMGRVQNRDNSFVESPPVRDRTPESGKIPEGAGETTLLDAGAGETTLLSGAGGAYLIRKKNGEKIAVNLQNFRIGKERRKVHYCISDNTSVSRIHCEIVKKGADYYVIDQGSTNFTFVNGVQLNPNKETLLSDQSVLKISDEEFEFHLS